jgi:hypothetical protein
MRLNVTNRGDKSAAMVLILNNYNGDNLSINQSGPANLQWQKINANKFEIRVTV